MDKILIVVFAFFLIFQPMILPVNTIYIFGLLSIGLIIITHNGSFQTHYLTNSGAVIISRGYIGLLVYLIIVSAVNILLGGPLALDNRIRAVNQLIVLTGIEVVEICYLIELIEKRNGGMKELVEVTAYAGALQGICSIAAYISPYIRTVFLRYSGDVFKNAYVIERRGYGFSGVLLDTYGYGMGLIAGVVLLTDYINSKKKIPIIVLCLISILLNARTGIVVFAIAFILYLFKAKNNRFLIFRFAIAIISLLIIYNYAIPYILDIMITSKNINIAWVGKGLSELLNVIQNNDNNLENASFLSDITHFPNDLLDLLIGTGHTAYRLKDILGFHSDIGYVNLIWEFGIVGSVAYFWLTLRLYNSANKASAGKERLLILFMLSSFFVVLFKGILIGYNPGVVVNYLMVFSMIYFGTKDNQKKNQIPIKNEV